MAEPDAWDDEDFEPAEPTTGATGGDKWIGEDEDEDVKDNWDEEDDDENKDKDQKVVQVKKKKTLKEKIAEKEAKKVEERRKKEEELKEMTPEDALAEKLRRQKMQEEADLALAKEAFGVSDVPGVNRIDTFRPSSKEDFETFVNLLKEKITAFEMSPYYVQFLENLYRDLAVGLEPEDLKKLGSTLNTLANEKVKAQKGPKGKKKKGPKLVAGKEAHQDLDAYGDAAGFDEFDDFM